MDRGWNKQTKHIGSKDYNNTYIVKQTHCVFAINLNVEPKYNCIGMLTECVCRRTVNLSVTRVMSSLGTMGCQWHLLRSRAITDSG